MTVTWTTKPFGALTTKELYDMLRLRVDVFVVEQKCIYPEVDGRDPDALHLMGRTADSALVAYARLLPPNDDAPGTSPFSGPPHIGRVVTHPAHRGKGLAYELMREAMKISEAAFGTRRSAVAAQTYLENFYRKLGYARQGPDYVWDGIAHVDMVREG